MCPPPYLRVVHVGTVKRALVRDETVTCVLKSVTRLATGINRVVCARYARRKHFHAEETASLFFAFSTSTNASLTQPLVMFALSSTMKITERSIHDICVREDKRAVFAEYHRLHGVIVGKEVAAAKELVCCILGVELHRCIDYGVSTPVRNQGSRKVTSVTVTSSAQIGVGKSKEKEENAKLVEIHPP